MSRFLPKSFMREHNLHYTSGRLYGVSPVSGRVVRVNPRTARFIYEVDKAGRHHVKKGGGWYKKPELHSDAARKGYLRRRGY